MSNELTDYLQSDVCSILNILILKYKTEYLRLTYKNKTNAESVQNEDAVIMHEDYHDNSITWSMFIGKNGSHLGIR